MARRSATHHVPGMSDEQAATAARLELPVLIATIVGVAVVVLISLDLDGAAGAAVSVLNWAVWLTYLIEAVIMLRLSPSRWEWVRRNPLDVIVLVLTPPMLPEALDALYALRLLRVIDLLPLLGQAVRFNPFRYAVLVTFLAALGGGLAFIELEEQQDLDILDGIYWAVTTITTVGYGDISPETVAGRFVTMGIMVMGPVIIGLVASGVGTVVADQIQRDLAERTAARAGSSAKATDEPDASEELQDELEGFSVPERLIIEQLQIMEDRLIHLERRQFPEPEGGAAPVSGPAIEAPPVDVPSDIATPERPPVYGDAPPAAADDDDDLQLT